MPIYINPFNSTQLNCIKGIVNKTTHLYELFKITLIFGNFLNTYFAEGELF